jgi:hypothetical protein
MEEGEDFRPFLSPLKDKPPTFPSEVVIPSDLYVYNTLIYPY